MVRSNWTITSNVSNFICFPHNTVIRSRQATIFHYSYQSLKLCLKLTLADTKVGLKKQHFHLKPNMNYFDKECEGILCRTLHGMSRILKSTKKDQPEDLTLIIPARIYGARIMDIIRSRHESARLGCLRGNYCEWSWDHYIQ